MKNETQIAKIPSTIIFLLTGGLIAALSAIIGGASLFYVQRILQSILPYWRQGFRVPDQNISSLLTPDILLIFLIGLFTFFPAFLGGIVLAWWLRKDFIIDRTKQWKLLGKGFFVGAMTGVILSLISLITSYNFNKAAPGRLDSFDPRLEIPKYILFAVEIIVVAGLAGSWTEKQLWKKLMNSINNPKRTAESR